MNTRKNTITVATASLLLGIPLLLFVAVLALLFVSATVFETLVPNVGAVHDGDASDETGHPPHEHEIGWPEICSTSINCTLHYDGHIQADMNWFYSVAGMPCVYGTCPGKYPLTVDGAFGTNTANAVKDFQAWESIQIDGAVGNQTRSSMEFALFATQTSLRMSSSYGTLRFPIYSVCKAITVNSGLDVLVPTRTSGEWSAFLTNKPSSVSVVDSVDCGISGGGGGGGSDDGGGDGGGDCSAVCDDNTTGCPGDPCSSCRGTTAPDNSCGTLPYCMC